VVAVNFVLPIASKLSHHKRNLWVSGVLIKNGLRSHQVEPFAVSTVHFINIAQKY
jgi:hypothetical protein